MAQTSPALSLPFIQAAQAQKHITHNEALRILDALVQLAVVDWQQSIPPAVPEVGVRYIVPVGGQQDWNGHDAEIAVFVESYWFFVTPQAGWSAQVVGGSVITFDGTEWIENGLENLAGLGINAASDSSNRLSVSAESTLLSHEGSGHQLKVNKNTQTDTASLLFQTEFSGRAEMGTAGEDNFGIKVSADGSTWTQAVLIDAQTGAVSLPNTLKQRVLDAPLILYVDAVLGDDNSMGEGEGASAFQTLSHAMEVAMAIDGNGNSVTVQLANGVHNVPTPVTIRQHTKGFSGIVVRGNPSDPAQVTLTGPDGLFEVFCGRLYISGVRMTNTHGNNAVLLIKEQGFCSFEQVDFGQAGAHVFVSKGVLEVTGNYTISGDAGFHIRLAFGAYFVASNSTVTLIGTRSFSADFMSALHLSVVKMRGCQYIGTSTGRRFVVATISILDTSGSGINFFPGSQAGVVLNGSYYL